MAAAKNKFLTKRYIGFFLAIVVFLLIKFVLPLGQPRFRCPL